MCIVQVTTVAIFGHGLDENLISVAIATVMQSDLN